MQDQSDATQTEYSYFGMHLMGCDQHFGGLAPTMSWRRCAMSVKVNLYWWLDVALGLRRAIWQRITAAR